MGEVTFIRSLYEKAVSECGREWQSTRLWEHYVKWELENKNYREVFSLYQRMIRNPINGLGATFKNFTKFLKQHNPKDLMDTADFLTLRKEAIPDSNDEGGSKDALDSENDMKSVEEMEAVQEKIMSNSKKAFKETGRVRFEQDLREKMIWQRFL